MEKTFSFHGSETIIIRKSARAKRISIRVSQEGKVRVIVPEALSYHKGLAFAEQKKDWIFRTLQKIRETKPPDRIFKPGNNSFTMHHRLLLKPGNVQKIHGKIQPHVTTITFPAGLSPHSPQLKSMISHVYVETLRMEARQYLPLRVRQLAAHYGYVINRIFLKNMKTRWGSCSASGNINLNIHLMQLPDHLIDYVILHELVHTVHKNHGSGFWQELDKITGKARILDRELKKYHIQIN